MNAAILILLLSACSPRSDQDRDGFGVLDGDCDDHDPTIHPAAPEVCNGLDDDCDGEVDDDAAGGEWYYVDADGDGFGLTAYSTQHCGELEGWATEHGDCDDGDPTINIGAQETCNGLDDDCDGRVDENAVDATTWYRDLDDDGHGADATAWAGCEAPEGWIDVGGDCDDEDPSVSPDAPERCWTEGDDDCDGDDNDPDAQGCVEWYQDADGDGWAGSGACLCEAEDPWLFDSSEDCDDEDPSVHPGAAELDDLVDDDCDGVAPVAVANAAWRLLGELPGDAAGQRVAAIGDMNGDGLGDVAVGAPGHDGGGADAGAAYVVYGPVGGDLELVSAHAVLLGAGGAEAGSGLSAAGDVNGDGHADLLVGAWKDSTHSSEAGAAYLLLGPVSGQRSLAAADGVLTGEAGGDHAGWSVGGGHDLDGDGLADIAVGAPGRDVAGNEAGMVYLLHGPVSGERGLVAADVSLQPSAYQGDFGWEVAVVDDLDGDGLGELIVGSPLDDGAFADAGSVSLYAGPVADRGDPDAAIHGEFRSDMLGWAVAGLPDHDGDGTADLAAAAYHADYLREDAGAVYLFTGALQGELHATEALAARIVGPTLGAHLSCVAAAGDVDGDGWEDLLLGAPEQGDGGGAWLLYGPVSGNVDLAMGGGVAFQAEGSDDALGSVAGPGDVDGDGHPDLLLGAWGASASGGAGAGYLVLGGVE